MINECDVFLLEDKWMHVVVSKRWLAGQHVYELLALEGPTAGEIVLTFDSRLMNSARWTRLQ